MIDKQTPAETVALAASKAEDLIRVAVDEAKKVVAAAAQSANVIASQDYDENKKLTNILSNSLREVFGENEEAKRFIDVSRIPLICKSIFDMHENIRDILNKLDNKYVMKVEFELIKKIVYGACAVILVAVLSALVYLVVHHAPV